MFGALIRAADRWRGLRFTEFELRQIAAVRKELDQEYEASTTPLARSSQPRVSSKSVPCPRLYGYFFSRGPTEHRAGKFSPASPSELNLARRTAPTMKDVAELAGVSLATVSRAFSTTSGDVSEKLRSRIEHAARQLDYTVNYNARSLRGSASDIVVVLVNDITNAFFPELLQGIEELEANLRPTAVFAANDESAIGAIIEAKTRGLRVPDDLTVVGFDDIEFAQSYDPPLTTVYQPRRDMGRRAMEILSRLIAEQRKPEREATLDYKLSVRASSAPPAGAPFPGA